MRETYKGHFSPLINKKVAQFEKILEILKNGGVVIFPTDTAFAIGCRVDDEKAVQRLFEIKNRSEQQAVPILVNGIEMARKYSEISEKVQNILNQFWPGALTVIAPKVESKISPLVLGMGDTVGVRQPNHDVSLELISEIGIPLIGTSANFHGKPTPYKAEDIDVELAGMVDGVLSGICHVGLASTIVDTTQNPWKVLRQGSIQLEL